jgi:hypothetical protein
MGLDLDRDSHIRLACFCQCTRDQYAEVRDHSAFMVIRLYESRRDPQTEGGTHCLWPRLLSKQCVFEG